MNEIDVAIVGAGGAGLTAAIYSARGGRTTAVFERTVTGGQIATTDMVENFPGFPEGVNGFDLALAMQQQAERFGARMVYEEVTSLTVEESGAFLLRTPESEWRARAVIMAGGAQYNQLGIPGEVEFTGRGVSYCATCDAAFFKDMDVAVVGGGDASLDEGLYATRYARSVTVIHRRDTMRASKVLQQRAFANPKMRFTWDTVVERVNGTNAVESLQLHNLKTGERTTMPVSALFVFIGQTPNNELLRNLVPLDPGGHAYVDLQMRTAIQGLFVAGDLRINAARQLIAASGDGATAGISAEHYLAGLQVLPRETTTPAEAAV